MHPNPRFNWQGRAEMGAFVTAHSFGTLFLETPEGPRVAQTPAVLLAEGKIGFHLARGNALCTHLEGALALFVVQGPHGYISPDWYEINDQVPTWNYESVELEGRVHHTDEVGLLAIIDALSTEHERRLAPKPVWTRAKMDPDRLAQMAKAITGFTMEIDHWRGTRKLGQNKATDVRLRAARAVEKTGNDSLAARMREAGD